MVLRKMKQTAEAYLNQTVTKVIFLVHKIYILPTPHNDIHINSIGCLLQSILHEQYV